jgi:hypothetical protein
MGAATAVYLCLTSGWALIQQGRKTPLPEGWWGLFGVLLIFLGGLGFYGYPTVVYLVTHEPAVVIAPVPLRLVMAICFILGGAVFVAQTTPGQLSRKGIFLTWLFLIMSLGTMAAIGSIIGD